ncbi:MAG TPA: metallophosphoesterase [Pseudomonadota bacterium]|nr:metallophosphoesterase [Pseudomonadota bacterium]
MATDFSRPAIRRQLQEVFRTAADLDTFLVDYFPGVSRRLSSGMSRTERESLLLQLHDPHEIVSAIDRAEAANRAADRTHSQTQQKGTSPIVGKPEVPSSQPAVPPGRPFALPKTCFLHVSDVHFASKRQVNTFLDLLEADLSQLKDEVPTLHGIVVSGDLTQTADHGEFQAAQGFLDEICETYKLGPKQLVIVPGNHDGSWRVSEAAYAIAAAPATPDAEKYRQRFLAFADFYQETTTQPYPLDFERQATLHEFKEQKVLFLGLNSAWECDHLEKNRGRASIHQEALSVALRSIRREPAYAEWLKIAVFHHPIQSDGEDRIKNTGFLDRLAVAGFRLALHGHMHSAQIQRHSYDVTADGRKLQILSAGTFGAPTHEWRAGIPLQYQILVFEGAQLRVISRCRENPDGPWRADGRWVSGNRATDRLLIDL